MEDDRRPDAASRGRPPRGNASVRRPPATTAGNRRTFNWRKTLFRLHGWIGLNTGLLLFVICLSGTFATLSHEIDWLLDARHRVEQPPVGGNAEYDWTAMVETVDHAYPDARNLGVYAPGASGFAAYGPGSSAVVYAALPSGETRKIYLNPYTGELRGDTSSFNTQRFFRTFHRRFFDGSRGIFLVTLWGFFLLIAVVSGFAFYRGWMKQLLTLRLSSGPRLRWSDLHKTIGIWGLIFGLIIALTGIFYFVEVLFQGAGDYEKLLPPPLDQVDAESLADFGPQPQLFPAGAYIAAAQRAYPDLRVYGLRMTHDPETAVYVDGQAGNVLTRNRANKVHLHPFTSEVIDIQKTEDLGAASFITDAADPLHFGYFGGVWTKVLWFVLGLLLSFSVLSGTYLWVVRSATGRRRRSFLLRGATVSTALTIAYMLVVGMATVRGIAGYASPDTKLVPGPDVATTEYEIRLDCHSPCEPDEGLTLSARFLGEGLPNYESIRISVAGADPVEMSGPSWYPTAPLPASAPSDSLRILITGRDGSLHSVAAAPDFTAAQARESGSPAWPDAVAGVWFVVVAFGLLTLGSIVAWLAMVLRVLRRPSVK